MSLRTQLLDAPARDTVAVAWEALVARSSNDEPVMTARWLAAWWQVFRTPGATFCAILVWDGAELVGALPLVRHRVRYRGVLPINRLDVAPSGEPEADEALAEYIAPLAALGREAEVAACFADALLAMCWDDLVLPRARGGSPAVAALGAALRDRGVTVRITESARANAAVLPATWDAYLASLQGSHRYALKRALRDFAAWAEGTEEVGLADDAAGVRRALPILASLHGERWAEQRAGGAFGSPRFSRFQELIAPALADGGQAYVMWLSAHGQPVAAMYNFVWNRRVYFYVGGRRVDLPDKVRAGLVLHAHGLQRAIAAGHVEYDFLGGDSQYKRQLGNRGHTLETLVAERPTLAVTARRRLDQGVELARGLRARWQAFRET